MDADPIYDAAVADLEEAIRSACTTLTGLENALLSEWHLVVGAITEKGTPEVRLVTSSNALLSHTLGALRFAEIQVEEWLRDEGTDGR